MLYIGKHVQLLAIGEQAPAVIHQDCCTLYGLEKVTSAWVMIFQSDALVDMDAEKRRQMETVFVL